jgi:hypothetical protein
MRNTCVALLFLCGPAVTKASTCIEVLEAEEPGFDPKGVEEIACGALGLNAADQLIPTPAQRDVEPDHTPTAGASGTMAQAEPVADIRPVSLAGATLSVASAEVGSTAVTAVTVNPGAFATVDGEDPESFARTSRFADVTLLLPFAIDAEGRAGGNRVDYVGVRARVNLTGLWEGGDVIEDATAAYKSALKTLGKASKEFHVALSDASARGKVRECYDELTKPKLDLAAIEGVCGRAVDLSLEAGSDAEKELRRQLERVRAAADRYYFGLDLRGDFGERLGEARARGYVLDVAGAGGWRPLGGALEVRGRVGLHYWKQRRRDAIFSVEGGASLGYDKRFSHEKRVRVALGLTGFYTNEDVRFEDNHLDLRGSLEIPAADGSSLVVGISAPLHERGESAKLTLAGDWGMLLPK